MGDFNHCFKRLTSQLHIAGGGYKFNKQQFTEHNLKLNEFNLSLT